MRPNFVICALYSSVAIFFGGNMPLSAYETAVRPVREPLAKARTEQDAEHKQATVSVIIPALNEAENLPHILPKIPSWVHEVVLVDGNSTDNTIDIARQLLPNINVVRQDKGRRGKGAGLRAGVAAASGDIVVLLDADGSTDPAEIPVFVSTLLAGADFAKGSRFLQGAGTTDMPFYRMVGNSSLVFLTNVLFRTRYTDITYGYNAFWREDANRLAFEIDNWACEIVNNIRAARNGLRIVEVASHEHERIAGEAKLQTWSAGWMILKAILRERFVKTEPAKPVLRRAQSSLLRESFLASYFTNSTSG
jgi:glycosyltransferase involved in cell wall biosynthesis